MTPRIPVELPSSTPMVTPPMATYEPVYQPAYALQPMEYAVVQEHPPMYDEPLAIEAPRKKNPFMVYWNKIGGGSFMISLLIHAGIIIAAYFIVETIVQEQKVDFLPGGGSKQGQEAARQLSQQVQNKKRSNLNKQTPMRKVVSSSTTSTIALPDVAMDTIDMPEMSSLMGGAAGSGGFGGGGAGGGFGKGIGIGGQTGFTALPPSMKSRCSTAERLQKLKENGGTAECEKAVSNALEYLKTKQNADGSWGKSAKGAMTGFALLCYLGRCETPESPFYGDNVMRGIMYLVELQKKNPNKMFSEATTGNDPAYEHGIATYALGEMYTLARMGSKQLPGMREAFESGVKTIIDNQQEKGSWVYDIPKGSYAQNREDLSVTGWQFQALKAAKLTSLKIDGLHSALDKVEKYFESKQTKDGGFGRPNRDGGYNQWDLSGVGILGLQTMGKGKSQEVKKGIKFAYELFKSEPPTWDNARLYNWYYYQQAFFQNGGEEWTTWNKQVLPAILSKQLPTGNWKNNGNGPGANSGGNDIYPTALCTLMLEVYYRYLKVGDKEQTSLFDRK